MADESSSIVTASVHRTTATHCGCSLHSSPPATRATCVNSECIAEIALLVACSEGFFTGFEQVIQKKGNQRPRQQALIARSTRGSSCDSCVSKRARRSLWHFVIDALHHRWHCRRFSRSRYSNHTLLMRMKAPSPGFTFRPLEKCRCMVVMDSGDLTSRWCPQVLPPTKSSEMLDGSAVHGKSHKHKQRQVVRLVLWSQWRSSCGDRASS